MGFPWHRRINLIVFIMHVNKNILAEVRDLSAAQPILRQIRPNRPATNYLPSAGRLGNGFFQFFSAERGNLVIEEGTEFGVQRKG